MKRRDVLAGLLLLGSCKRKEGRKDLLPPQVGAGWKRTKFEELLKAEIPAQLPPKVVRRIQTATYEGPGKLEVTLYELTSDAAALEAVQKTRPEADKLFFNRDQHYVLARWQKAERAALNNFVKDLTVYLRSK